MGKKNIFLMRTGSLIKRINKNFAPPLSLPRSCSMFEGVWPRNEAAENAHNTKTKDEQLISLL